MLTRVTGGVDYFGCVCVCPPDSKIKYSVFYNCNRVYCIHVPGHDPLILSFRSFSFLIGWVRSFCFA